MPRADLAAALERGADGLGIALEPSQVEAMLDFVALLQHWNRAFNLTAVRDPGEMIPRHLLDSLSIAALVVGPRVLDVGSGAGLPGLVLAIASPALHVTLLDAARKRTRFMQAAVRELGLGNVQVVRSRVEAYRPDGRYDTLVSRATLSLEVLAGLAPLLLRPGGRLVAMLGRAPAAAADAGARVVPLSVPGLAAQRHAAVLELP